MLLVHVTSDGYALGEGGAPTDMHREGWFVGDFGSIILDGKFSKESYFSCIHKESMIMYDSSPRLKWTQKKTTTNRAIIYFFPGSFKHQH